MKYKRQRLAIPKNNKKRGRYKSILERPEIIDKQGRMGDMEMDLIIGASPNEAILTMVDRKTDYIFIELLTHGRKSKPLARVVNKRLAFLKGVDSSILSQPIMGVSLVLIGLLNVA